MRRYWGLFLFGLGIALTTTVISTEWTFWELVGATLVLSVGAMLLEESK